ncbi:hypothetical protein [uncultured Desulfobulbus sp.]|uniref:hypothetical protein n=1 Tax=uncultured Desulfobulbus sp. TaxID=239745 RepID=UPI0029C982FD|nr:hypothetical protein [uncultured Desulfobulbus sp.]
MKVGRYVVAAGIIILAISVMAVLSRLGPPGRRVLAKGVFAFDRSPDGMHVAVINGRNLTVITLPTGRIQSRIPMPNSGYSNELGGWFVSWSPTSDEIVVVRNVSRSRSQLMLINADDAKCIILRESDAIGRPAWSPNGKRLAWFEETAKRVPMQMSSLPKAGPVQMPVSELRVATMPDMTQSRTICNGMLSNVQWTSNGHIASGQRWNRIVFIKPDTKQTWYIEHEWNGPSHGVYSISSWEVSPDAKDLVYGFGGKVWMSRLSTGAQQVSIADFLPLEMKWTPGGESLLLVTTDPKSQQDAPPGAFPMDPPHILHKIAKDGTEHQVLFPERDGISDLKCISNKQILYLSSGNLCMRDL